jgi:hypothetical protein
MIAFYYFQLHGLPDISLCAFNIIGQRQPLRLDVSAFAQQMTLAELFRVYSITASDLSACYDFVDTLGLMRIHKMTRECGCPVSASCFDS